jgi:ATP-binding cassette subfamily C exporter for protease/lipase
MMNATAVSPGTKATIESSQLLSLLRPFKKELGVLFAISAVTNVLMLTPTLYMLQIFDRVMVSQSILSLLILSIIAAGLYGVQAFAEWLRTKVIVATGIQIDKAINRPMFYASMQPDFGQQNKNPIQALSDLTVIRQWLTGSGLYAFLDAPWAPFYIFIMFLIHPVLGWFSVACVIFLTGFAFYAMVKSKNIADATADEERELNRFLFRKLKNAEVIEAHGMVPNFYNRWWGEQVGFLKAQTTAADQEERLTASSKQIKVFLNSLAIAVGAVLAIEGEITMGAMIAAGLLASRAMAPVDSLVFGWKGLLLVRTAFSRLQAQIQGGEKMLISTLHDRPQLIRDPSAPQALVLELKDLSLNRPSGVGALLSRLSFRVESGDCLVIVGPSGAGKSTLAKVLVGLIPPDEGTVKLGRHLTFELSQSMRRSSVGFLPQESELFQETVAKNIARMGTPEPDRVIEVATALGLHETILGLSKGYDTVIGDQGGVLSGGQRQRLALARAFYCSPKLIVLDEPNSNLDEPGEAALAQVVLTAKSQGAVVVIVSHRPATLSLADHLLVLNQGQVQFFGSPSSYSSLRPTTPPSS